jgi:hypothetical protein
VNAANLHEPMLHSNCLSFLGMLYNILLCNYTLVINYVEAAMYGKPLVLLVGCGLAHIRMSPGQFLLSILTTTPRLSVQSKRIHIRFILF